MTNPTELHEKALTFSLSYLSLRPRSEKELHDYLVKKNISIEVIESVLDRLKEGGHVDDRKFVHWWCEQRRHFRNKSSFVIKQELFRKGINKSIIDEEMEESLDEDFEHAKAVYEKNARRYSKYTGREFEQKMGAYLARKGFSWDIIRKVIDQSED